MSNLQDIKILIKEEKFAQANKMLDQILLRESQNQEALKLKRELQNLAYNKNLQLVDQKLAEYQDLFTAKKYAQLIPKLKKLQTYAPGYSKLDKFVLKVYNEYEKTVHKNKGSEIKQLQQKLDQLISQNNGKQAILDIETYAVKHQDNPVFQKMVIETKRKVIDKKLKNNKKALKRLNAPSKFEFLKKLYQIDITYPVIQKELYKAKKELESYDKKQKKVYLREAKIQLKILYNQKKYPECIQACKELLKVFPNNKSAVKYFEKATSRQIQQNYLMAYAKITQSA